MTDVLPAQAGLSVNSVRYRYSVQKRLEDALKVHTQNVNPIDGGYTFRETDDWSGGGNGTIDKIVPVSPAIPREYWGNGSIVTEGEGLVLNPTVQYSYRYDPCYDPLINPECPGYEDATLEWLIENNIVTPEVDDPYDSDEVQNVLNSEADIDEEEQAEQDGSEEQEEEDEMRQLAADGAMIVEYKLLNEAYIGTKNNILQSYIVRDIPGGTYQDTIVLPDNNVVDNRKALRSLASDNKMQEIVRSQYDN
jgi:hypothetical protein